MEWTTRYSVSFETIHVYVYVFREGPRLIVYSMVINRVPRD